MFTSKFVSKYLFQQGDCLYMMLVLVPATFFCLFDVLLWVLTLKDKEIYKSRLEVVLKQHDVAEASKANIEVYHDLC